ncbi:hypothetical protein SPFM12_00185 [Salmonella phage SPFM12]|nr:hypothetical protein SPFM12_00185 [Salmonella phage SPFM12]
MIRPILTDRVLKEEPSLPVETNPRPTTLTLKRDPELISWKRVKGNRDNNPANHLYGNILRCKQVLRSALFDFAQRHSDQVYIETAAVSGLTVAPTHRKRGIGRRLMDGRDIVGIAQMRLVAPGVVELAETVIARIQHANVETAIWRGAICEELEYDVRGHYTHIGPCDAYAELSKDDKDVILNLVSACHSKLFDKVITASEIKIISAGDVEQKLVEKGFVLSDIVWVGLALVLDHTGFEYMSCPAPSDPTLTCHYFEEFVPGAFDKVYVVRNKETWEGYLVATYRHGTDTVRARRLKEFLKDETYSETVAKLFRSSIRSAEFQNNVGLFTRYPHVVTALPFEGITMNACLQT